MSPSFNSFGSNPSVSQLVWDTDLVIPDGKAIESASGEVGIIGDVSISGNLSSEGAISSDGDVTAAQNLVGVNAVLSEKPLVFAESVVTPISITLQQTPERVQNYTSPDYPLTGAVNDVQYIFPSLTWMYYSNTSRAANIVIQGKSQDNTYTTAFQISIPTSGDAPVDYTSQAGLLPPGCKAIRLVMSLPNSNGYCIIDSDLTLSLAPQPIY